MASKWDFAQIASDIVQMLGLFLVIYYEGATPRGVTVRGVTPRGVTFW